MWAFFYEKPGGIVRYSQSACGGSCSGHAEGAAFAGRSSASLIPAHPLEGGEGARYTENELPQPQVVLAFGLRITNCAALRAGLFYEKPGGIVEHPHPPAADLPP